MWLGRGKKRQAVGVVPKTSAEVDCDTFDADSMHASGTNAITFKQ